MNLNLKSDSHLSKKCICFNENLLKMMQNTFYFILKLPSCKLCNNKCMIALTQITNTEVFAAYLAVLVFKLLSCKVLFIKRKDNTNC